jgi:hypothetical protein
MDPLYCVLLGLAVFLEIFIELGGGALFGFSNDNAIPEGGSKAKESVQTILATEIHSWPEFKKQAQWSRWANRILECVQKYKEGLALAFTPKLNAALKRIITYQRDADGKLISDGSLTIWKQPEGEPEADPLDGVSSVYAMLDGTYRLCDEDTLVSNVPIRVFIMGDLAFFKTVVGKEGMGKAHCHWCKLPSSQWQTLGHAPGPKWTLEDLK